MTPDKRILAIALFIQTETIIAVCIMRREGEERLVGRRR